MKSLDFRGEIQDGQIPAGEKVEVVVRWGISGDEPAWRNAGRRRFESAYAPDDSVYEQLIHDPPAG